MSAMIEPPVAGIRNMTPDDLDQVMAIETAIYPFPWSRGIFHDCIRVGYRCHVFDEDGEIRAYSVSSMGAGESHILTVCVHPDFQGQGLGQMMMTHMIDEARQAGVETMLLEVRPSNTRAITLYHKMKFNEVGVRPDYYPAEQGREDALIMALQLGDKQTV